MANISNLLHSDPTLDAVDRAIEQMAALEKPRPYLGMSEIGEECNRRIWYSFRWIYKWKRKAFLVKCAERGNKAEILQAERLRMVEGVNLITENENGKQFEFIDCNGHFKGHCDGTISGLLQAPVTTHIWEHKEKEEKFINKLRKLKSELDEKSVLREWDPTYYAQAILYMFYKGLTRHYLTATTPGGRETESIRTNEDFAFALQLKAKAQRIIDARNPPEKIGDAAFFKCKICNYKEVCHQNEMPDRNCRSCLHSTPVEDGAWHCARFGKKLTFDEQLAGCPAQLFIPSLVPGKIISAIETSIKYQMSDGSVWEDSEAK